jgi:hypothetical protein
VLASAPWLDQPASLLMLRFSMIGSGVPCLTTASIACRLLGGRDGAQRQYFQA